MSYQEKESIVNIFSGMLIMGVSMLIMVAASLLGGNSDTNIMSPSWLIVTYLIVTLSEILISPMGQSYVSKVAPPKIQGLMMGGWFLATSLGSLGAGMMFVFYADFQHHEYFLILTAILVFSAFLAFFSMKRLKRFAN